MGRELFATKLLSGRATATAKASWWPRHARAMGRYMILAGTAAPGALAAVRELALTECSEWEAALPPAARSALMARHAALEMAIVEAALVDDAAHAVQVDRHGEALLKNAAEQAAALGRAVRDFPETTFRRLLAEHVAFFVQAVRRRNEGSGGPGERACGNTLALAAFTAEWF